jgi:hypothetical protein
VLKPTYQNLAIDKSSLERKIEDMTEGLPKQVSRKLKSVKNDRYFIEIANYVAAIKTEVNFSDNYRSSVIKTLSS